MPVIKEGKLVADDWVRLVDEDADIPDGPIIVSLARWQKKEPDYVLRDAPLGIFLKSTEAPSVISDDLDRFSLIALEFPRFADGRAYSYARLLRERWGYRGELRAVGNVLRDQYLFMLRCGFDSVEIVDAGKAQGFAEAMVEFSVFYQPAADRRKPAWALRHQAR